MNDLEKSPQQGQQGVVATSIFSNMELFENAQRIAKVLCASKLVPKDYQGAEGLPNALIIIDLATRMGESPMLLMQNVHVINGRPSFGSPFLIGKINSTRKFETLEFKIHSEGKKTVHYTETAWNNGQKSKVAKTIEIENIICVAETTEIKSGKILKSPAFSIETAVKEGWYTKDGSKWPTMPELMLSYRCASAFANLYCPEVKGGIPTREEIEDIEYIDISPNKKQKPGDNQMSMEGSLNDKLKNPPPAAQPEKNVKEMDTFHDANVVEDEVEKEQPESTDEDFV